MAPPNPRVKAAFMAMKAIGISEKKTKPVLKKLLKVFDKNWDLIEEENYRVLADAIFEDEDNEVAEKDKIPETTNDQRDPPEEEETQLNEEAERPLKRLRLKHQGTSSTQPNANPTLKVPKPEPCELEDLQGQRGQPVASASLAKNKGKQPMLPNSSGPVNEKGKKVASAPQGVQIKEPNVGPPNKNKQASSTASLIKVKDEPFTGDLVSMEPLAVVLPERSNSEARPNTSTPSGKQTEHAVASKSVNGVDKGTEALTSPIEIATSSQGEVKICLSCNPGVNSTNINPPDLQAVFKKVEDNCIKTYKVMDPTFTVKGVMKELCDCVVELQTNGDGPTQGRSNNKGTCLNGSMNAVSSDNVAPTTENDVQSAENDVSDAQEKLDHDGIQCVYDMSDITRGQEDTKVSLEKSNSDRLPNFLYITQNVVWHDADVKFSLAQIGDRDCCISCNGDCFALSPSCNCVHKNGGESSYTSDGLLREEFLEEYISIVRDPKDYLVYCKDCPLERLKNEDMVDPCKGHLKRKFIKECWVKCGCIRNCGNRVVQRGLKCNLQVFWTPEGKGWGLKTLEEIPKGAFVCEYIGEILTITELQKRMTTRNNDKHSYSVVLDTDWASKALKEKEVLCLDSTFYGNVARFINHRCADANLIEIPVEVETPKHHYYHVALFATRKIEALEELTWDYGVDFDDSEYHIKAFRCLCGSQFCRNMKRSSRSRSSLTLR